MSRLCVFFEAGGVRYAVEALSVLEVARPGGARDLGAAHVDAVDLSVLLGGPPQPSASTLILMDTNPSLAARVTAVAGVYDAQPLEQPHLARRLAPWLSPAVRGAIVLDRRLHYELDPSTVQRGLSGQSRRPAVVAPAAPPAQALVFESGGQTYGVGLAQVLQVGLRQGSFNAAPSPGAFLGATVHRALAVPVYALADVKDCEELLVLVDVYGEPMALSASRALGVLSGARLEGVSLVDLERTFS